MMGFTSQLASINRTHLTRYGHFTLQSYKLNRFCQYSVVSNRYDRSKVLKRAALAHAPATTPLLINNLCSSIQNQPYERYYGPLINFRLFSISNKESSDKSNAKMGFMDGQINKLRKFVKMYGMVGVGVYTGLYVGTLGLLFVGIKSGLVVGDDVLLMLQRAKLDEWIDASLLSTHHGSLAVAWILTKFTEPVRMAVAVAVTPSIARAFGKAPPKLPKTK